MKSRPGQGNRETRLDRELHDHIERHVVDFVRSGVDEASARRRARIAFGGLEQVKEACRDSRSTRWLEDLGQDLRYGLRMLRRSPVFSAVVVLSLALGIGANTAIFSLIDAVMLRTLPVADPSRLVLLQRSIPEGIGESFSFPQFDQFRKENDVFLGTFGFAYREATVKDFGADQRVGVELVSRDYFSTLGVKAQVGRFFLDENSPVAVISDSFWKSRYAGELAAVGKEITVNARPLTIIGIAPPEFSGVSLDYSVDLWVPLALQPPLDGPPSNLSAATNWVRIMGRLKPGVSVEQAAANLSVLFQQPQIAGTETGRQRLELVAGGQPVSALRKPLTQPLAILMGLVALVLLLACVNIANLSLARMASRQREVLMRIAIGAGRGRLARQFLTESLLLAALGGTAGVAVAYWGNRALVGLLSARVNFVSLSQLRFQADHRVFVFTFGISVLTGLLFGLLPARRAASMSLATDLKGVAAASGRAPRGMRLDKTLVVSELALSLLLLSAAALFVLSFQRLADVRLGFNPRGVAQMKFFLPGDAQTPAQFEAMWAEVLERLRHTPGVTSASMSQPGLFSRSTSQTTASRSPGGPAQMVHTLAVTPGFLKTIEAPLFAGRDFSAADRDRGRMVVMLNQTAARMLFATDQPVGQRVFGGLGVVGAEVVGLVGDTKYDSVLGAAPPIVFVPLAQFPLQPHFRVIEVRIAETAAAILPTIRQTVSAVNRSLSVEPQMLSDLVDQTLLVQRLIAQLTGLFAMLGLLLACMGVYGLMSYLTSTRTKEIGIRMALGATRAAVLWSVLRETAGLIVCGVAIGLALALGAGQLVASQLFGLTAADPGALLAATALISAMTLLAAYIPARRASRIDPLRALRCD